jgi:hypothetical protein
MRRLLVCSIFILALGCDRSRAPMKIPDGSASNTSSTAPAVPTTQKLMDGPYKTVKLDPLPLTASVPESWDNKVPEGTHLNFLQGPALDGMDVQLSLEPGSSMRPDQVKNVLQGAKKEADKDKQNVRKFEIRQMGDVQAMEEQRILSNPDNPRQQAIDWRITYFVPRDIDTNSYTVEVLGLSQDRFEKCQPLLRKIIDSIEYSPS